MRNVLRAGCLSVAMIWLAACATMTVNTITNLTPSRLPKKENGQYMFSVEFDTRQRTMVKDSLRVSVVIGEQLYPMERTPLVPDRWETLVPIGATETQVNFHYRFEYDYKAIPEVKPMVMDSKNYRLNIVNSW